MVSPFLSALDFSAVFLNIFSEKQEKGAIVWTWSVPIAHLLAIIFHERALDIRCQDYQIGA